MRRYMRAHGISYYHLSNEGIDAQTLQRIRHDKPVTTRTLGKLCGILECQPGDLIEYITDPRDLTEPLEKKDPLSFS